MKKSEEKKAVFWCDTLSQVIYGEIEPEETYSFLKSLASREIPFPDGEIKKPSFSTLCRVLKRYQEGGFDRLARKPRSDLGAPRNVPPEVIEKAVELKKEQPYRSPKTINRFLEEMFAVTVPSSTLYRHLKQANATRLKLGVSKTKVRKRWSRDHTHDLWVGDFEDGPYVLYQGHTVPTYLSAFIDCHSRYAVESRYYLRENLDVLIDSLIRALTVHGAPLSMYVDNAKIYHANGLKAACHRLHIQLLHRPPDDPAPGGLIERFFQTVQGQFEAEVRAGNILTLEELNRTHAAWLAVDYHRSIHSETSQPPRERYQTGLNIKRQVDMARFMESFLQKKPRTVHKTFSDVQLDKRFYRVDPKWRSDRVEVHFDPFSAQDTVKIYSLQGQYMGTGTLHDRTTTPTQIPQQKPQKPKHNLLDLLVNQHKQQIAQQTGSIDYRKVIEQRPWPFFEFAKTVAQLMGRKSGLSDLTAGELETLKKCYNQSLSINPHMVELAFEKALQPTLPHIIAELKNLIKEEQHVS